VDVGVNNQTGEYDWMIEFQCIKEKRLGGREKVQFYAMNFYSKEYANMEERILLMEQKARERGLGPFLDTGKSLAIQLCTRSLKLRYELYDVRTSPVRQK
jgi:hypothetical protein